MGRARFGLLGPLLVDGAPTPVGPPRPRALLAVLLLRANRPVPRRELAELLWDGRPPEHGARTVSSYAMRLRRALGPELAPRLTTHGHGYAFHVDPAELDVSRAERLREAALDASRGGDQREARSRAEEALELWRGDPLADIPEFLGRAAVLQHLTELRLQLTDLRLDAALALGDHHAVLPELRAATAHDPLHEPRIAQLMLALHRAGRRAEALETYVTAAASLSARAGLTPGPSLRALHLRLLSDDPSLTTPEPPTRPPGSDRPQAGALPEPPPATPEDAAAARPPARADGVRRASAHPPMPERPSRSPEEGTAADALPGESRAEGAPTDPVTPEQPSGSPKGGPVRRDTDPAAQRAAQAGDPPHDQRSPRGPDSGAGLKDPAGLPGEAAAVGTSLGGSEAGVGGEAAGRGPRRGRAVPRELPGAVRGFVGREAEEGKVEQLLLTAGEGGAAVVVVSGPGGIGKTALAVRVAQRLREEFPDGQLYAELGSADVATVQARFVAALGETEPLPQEPGARAARYRSLLARRRVLLVLDNASDSAQVRDLVPGDERCAVLVTSRSPLADLDGVRTLALPLLTDHQATALLAELIGRDRIEASPDAALATVLEACGGLPLALRIVGARLASRPAWPVSALATRLADRRGRLGELTAGELSVRAGLDVGYRGLHGRAVAQLPLGLAFRLLGAGGLPVWSTAAAAALFGTDETTADRVLDALADAQLLQAHRDGGYRCHDLVALYSAELSETEGTATSALARLADWYLRAVEAADRLLRPGGKPLVALPAVHPAAAGAEPASPVLPDAAASLNWLDAELGNLVVLIRRCWEAGLDAPAWQLPTLLFPFLVRRKYWLPWEESHALGLRAAARAGVAEREAELHNGMAMALALTGRADAAITHLETALELNRAAGAEYQIGRTLNNLGMAHRESGRPREAIGYLHQALEYRRRTGPGDGEAATWSGLGELHQDLEEFGRATDCYRRALALLRAGGNLHAQALTLNGMGESLIALGEHREAATCLRDACGILEETGDPMNLGIALGNLATALRRLGHRGEAEDADRRAQELMTETQLPHGHEPRRATALPATRNPLEQARPHA
ncbi:AfsR/SARP family transcriptional regulator [Streptacidiphilus rugosus]|uniref:AfsR/SARP family transcriptional regulator n=1 Tax=Streptacidiphilus rugosus TaxID=405783 RepID=UPI00055D3D37|nr:BTAD domain-containing putative transcriptional regulator [Streptacidiphilus rugosus]